MLEEGSVDDQEIRRLADKVYVPGYKNLGGGVLAFDYEHETDDEAVDAVINRLTNNKGRMDKRASQRAHSI